MQRDAARHTAKSALIMCLAPDVCKTPSGAGTPPIPYMIASRLEWSEREVKNVTFGGEPAFTMASRTRKVVGNEPGAAGGVASGVSQGWCRPKTNKSTFFIHGHEVIQDDCVYEMNCNGPDGASNTLGKLLFLDTGSGRK